MERPYYLTSLLNHPVRYSNYCAILRLEMPHIGDKELPITPSRALVIAPSNDHKYASTNQKIKNAKTEKTVHGDMKTFLIDSTQGASVVNSKGKPSSGRVSDKKKKIILNGNMSNLQQFMKSSVIL